MLGSFRSHVVRRCVANPARCDGVLLHDLPRRSEGLRQREAGPTAHDMHVRAARVTQPNKAAACVRDLMLRGSAPSFLGPLHRACLPVRLSRPGSSGRACTSWLPAVRHACDPEGECRASPDTRLVRG